METDPPVARFRFVSAAIDPEGAGKTFGDLIADLQWVCDNVVVPSLAANDWQTGDVVLSVSSQETEFGVFDPVVTQFFQPYTIDGDTCRWEDF